MKTAGKSNGRRPPIRIEKMKDLKDRPKVIFTLILLQSHNTPTSPDSFSTIKAYMHDKSIPAHILVILVLFMFVNAASAGPAAYAACQATCAGGCWYAGPLWATCYANCQSLCSYLLPLPGP